MKEKIIDFIKPVFQKLGYQEYLSISESEKADYQINSAFAIAKINHVNPIEVAKEIEEGIKKLDLYEDYFKNVISVNPGFININVSDKLINSFIKDFINNGFIKKTDSKELYFLDYGGPNIAKPLHIGHLRPAIIGESFKRILKAKGYNVISDVHFGDFGLQIGEVIYGLLKENKRIDDITLEYLNYLYPHMSKLCKEDENILKECKKVTYDFQHGNPEYQKIYEKIKEVSLSDIKRLYNYLDVDFDLWLGESDSRDYFEKMFNALEDKKILELDNGEQIVRVKTENDNKEMPPVRLINNEGGVGYATTDIATILKRNDEYHPDHIYYFADSRQSLHFEGVFRVSKLLGVECNLKHCPFGTINGSDGKPFKTRSGDAVSLNEILNMVKDSFLAKREDNKNMSISDLDKQVNAIIKYADLQNNREKNYNFDITKFSEVSGKTGPYILYSAIRIRKILDNNEIISTIISDNIYNEIDRALRLKLLDINKALDKAINEVLPSVIAEYIYDLCNITNSFYQNININNITDINVKNDYLNILKLTYDVINACLNMLIIKIPSEM